VACVALDNGTGWDVVTQGPVFTGFSLSRNHRMLALTGSTPRYPAEIFAGALSRRRCDLQRLTHTNPDVERAKLAAQEVVRWKAEDGLEIEGVLLKPLGFTNSVRYPLVIVAHGGPEGCYLNGWTTSWLGWGQLLAQRGFVVLFPNYRGSIGRGEAFERADHKDLGGREFGDVLAGIDDLERRGWVDPARVGIGGGSYGGYFSAWAATAHTDRFAAAVDFAGISNWTSMQGVSDIPLENAMVHWELPFYDNMQLYWERSPMAHVNECRTPLLIGQGDSDKRVPPGQAIELYTALRLLGKEVQLVRYPRAGHGLNEVAHQLDFLNRSLEWYEQHLMPEPEAAAR
jgi:dipeptidyl aminopeptidase/acylaminoacyl peptidase